MDSRSADLCINDLTVAYGSNTVVEGVSIRVERGVKFLIGINSAGKSTILKAILGGVKATAGSITVAGDEVRRTRRDTTLRHIGYLPQQFDYPRHLSLRGFVEYVGWLRGMPAKDLPAAAESAIKKVGLADKANARLGQLSGGMLRRAGVAQALVHSPEVLLLDEPTAGLDPRARVAIRSLLGQLGRSTTVLVTTHILEDAAEAGSSVAILSGRRIVYEGAIADLIDSHGQPTEDLTHQSALERAFLAVTELAEGDTET